MKIESVKCTQFAGLRNKNISFSQGLNVVYGGNESGKTTMLGLIHGLLFKGVNLSRRSKSDTEFSDRFAPSETVSGLRGNFYGGELSFTHGGKAYRVSKQWGADKSCVLEAGSALIGGEDAQEQLRTLLTYGEGIYNDVVFPSQAEEHSALMAVLGESEDGLCGDLNELVSRAVSASGSVTSEKIAEAIDGKIEELSAKWDVTRDAPTRRGLTKGVGLIYAANSKLEEAEAEYDKILKAGKVLEEAKAANERAQEKCRLAENTQKAFDGVYADLIGEKRVMAELARLEAAINPRLEADRRWESLSGGAAAAKRLKAELALAEKLRKLSVMTELKAEIERLSVELAKYEGLDDDCVSGAAERLNAVERLENSLRMSLHAVIERCGSAEIKVYAARTGERLQCLDNLDIDEAVVIEIPNVAKIRIAPKNVEVEGVTGQISEKKRELAEIFGSYGTDSIDGLRALLKEAKQLRSEQSSVQLSYKRETTDISYEQLKAECEGASCRSREEISGELSALCGVENVDAYIGRVGGILSGYEAKFTSIQSNAEELDRLKAERSEYERKLSAIEEKCREFRGISDPDSHKAGLAAALDTARKTAEEAIAAYAAAEAELDSLSSDMTEAGEAVVTAREALGEAKENYRHWVHIKSVYERLTAEIKSNPMKGISDRFAEYLKLISGDRLSITEDMDTRARAVMSSGENIVGYDLLSEGARDTASLALRLAVLEELFPDGGGLAVFDDPFTDMDNKRRDRAVGLISRFAEKNQVIFTTCDPHYTTLPSVNVINM